VRIVYQVVRILISHGPKVLVAEVWVAEILLQALNLDLVECLRLPEEPIKKHASTSIEPIVGRNQNQNQNQNRNPKRVVQTEIERDAYEYTHEKTHKYLKPKPKPKPER
jgi:hypothetical protein